jgi:hypothetical protein
MAPNVGPCASLRDFVASASGGGVGPAPELGQAKDAGGKAPNDAVSIRVIPLTATKRSGCSTISFSRRKLVRIDLIYWPYSVEFEQAC